MEKHNSYPKRVIVNQNICDLIHSPTNIKKARRPTRYFSFF